MPRARQATLGDIPAMKEIAASLPKRSLENEHRPQRAARKRGDDALNTLAERVGKMMESLGQDTANKVEPVEAKVESKPAELRKCSVCAQPGHNKRTCPGRARPPQGEPVRRAYKFFDPTWAQVLRLVRSCPREEQVAFKVALDNLGKDWKPQMPSDSPLIKTLGGGPAANLLVGIIYPYLKERGLL